MCCSKGLQGERACKLSYGRVCQTERARRAGCARGPNVDRGRHIRQGRVGVGRPGLSKAWAVARAVEARAVEGRRSGGTRAGEAPVPGALQAPTHEMCAFAYQVYYEKRKRRQEEKTSSANHTGQSTKQRKGSFFNHGAALPLPLWLSYPHAARACSALLRPPWIIRLGR